jgi:hypothetical protein
MLRSGVMDINTNPDTMVITAAFVIQRLLSLLVRRRIWRSRSIEPDLILGSRRTER